MDVDHIVDGLISYLILVALLTFHEFGHAWTAMKCGDDTAKLQGRVSLNPIVHIELIGTVLLPLFQIFGPSYVTRFVLGWAKPVPVNLTNLGKRPRDEILITLAGPGMNLVLAVALVGLARLSFAFNSEPMVDICLRAADLSLLLCYFNLIPIPPLDGSHLMRWLTGMKYETHWRLSQPPYGFIMIIIFLQLPYVRPILDGVTRNTLYYLMKLFGLA